MTFADLQNALADLETNDKLLAKQFLDSQLAEVDAPGTAEGGLSQDLTDQSEQAYDFYMAELRPSLEPRHNGDYVAIDVDSKSFEIAPRLGQAFRALKSKHPHGKISVLKIGPADYALASRMRGERPR